MEIPAYHEALLNEEEIGQRPNSVRSPSWGIPSNLDNFFTNMYTYHYQKGIVPIVLTQVCSIVTLAFTVSFSSFLIAFVNWSDLLSCDSEMTCENFEEYIVKNPFRIPSFHGFVSMLYIILFGLFWLWSLIGSIQNILHALEMDHFYREVLGIENVEEMSWNDVVRILIDLHYQGKHRIAVKERLTEHDIVSRIMRKENFMIAFINKDILDIKLPWWVTPFIGPQKLFLTQSLEWSINFCVLHHMFDEQFRISKLFKRDENGLRFRLIVMGIVHAALLPFMIVFMMINFFLQNATDFHSNKAYLGPRKWSHLALWKFREFNELPEIFESRMNKAMEPTNKYLSIFRNPLLTIVGKCTSYISGAFVATLLFASLFEEGALLYVKIGDKNLLWFLGIFSAIFAGARSLIPDEGTVTRGLSMELLEQMSAFTHYYPEEWIGNEHKMTIRNEVLELFPVKITLFGLELLSVIMTPIVLCFSMPNCVPNLLEFITKHAVHIEGVGDICDYACFDFTAYGDTRFGAERDGRADRPNNGKMEMSCLNFHLAHPKWDANKNGQTFLRRIEAYKTAGKHLESEQMASLLEQTLHASIAGSLLGAPVGGRPSSENTPDAVENLPSALLSIMNQNNIDYKNDFYWLRKFEQKRKEDPAQFESSLMLSMSQSLGFGSIFGGGAAVASVGGSTSAVAAMTTTSATDESHGTMSVDQNGYY